MNKYKIFALAAGIFCLVSTGAFALELSESEREAISPETIEGKTIFENESMKIVESHNLLFKIAKDRALEKGPGTVGPVEIDAYMYYKFEKVAQQIEGAVVRIEKRLDALEAKIALDPGIKEALELQIKQQKEKEESEARAKRPKVLTG